MERALDLLKVMISSGDKHADRLYKYYCQSIGNNNSNLFDFISLRIICYVYNQGWVSEFSCDGNIPVYFPNIRLTTTSFGSPYSFKFPPIPVYSTSKGLVCSTVDRSLNFS